MTDMFEDWKRVFGSKLKDRQAIDVRTAELWTIALQQLKITPKEFNQALAKSITLEWPPTAPADFLALARTDSSLDYPSTQSAFDIACQNCGMRGQVERNWQHEVIHETATRVGWGKLANADYNYLKHFDSIYQQVISEHKAGATFLIPESHQIEHSHNPVKPDSPKAAEIDDFLNKFRRKEQQA